MVIAISRQTTYQCMYRWLQLALLIPISSMHNYLRSAPLIATSLEMHSISISEQLPVVKMFLYTWEQIPLPLVASLCVYWYLHPLHIPYSQKISRDPILRISRFLLNLENFILNFLTSRTDIASYSHSLLSQFSN